MLHVLSEKKTITKVPIGVITLILGSKWRLSVMIYFFCIVVLVKSDNTKVSLHYFDLFFTR